MDKGTLIALLKKYRQGHCTEEERQLLFRWLDAMEADAIDESPAADMEGIKAAMMQQIPVLAGKPRRPWTQLLLRAAAVMLPVAVAGYWIFHTTRIDKPVALAMQWQTINNNGNHIRVVQLPDSSTAYLGAYSTIQVPRSFTGDTRQVILMEGKAFFDTRTDPAHPFIVTDASGVRTTVLGTSFIAEFSKQTKVSRIAVASGKVCVNNTILLPAQRVTVSNETITRDEVSISDLIAWTKGETILHNANLQDLMQAIKEHYGVQAHTTLDITRGSYNLRIPATMPLQAAIEVVEKISYKPKIHFVLSHGQLSIE